MARSLWTGSISFGLVNVPVKAFTAARDHDVHFHQLDKKSGARIRYRKVSEATGKEVDSDDIALGYETKSGKYVTFDEKELDALRSEIEGLPRRVKPDPKALRMAKQLIEGLSGEWDPARYHDTYTDALRKRITAKNAGKEAVETAEEPAGRVLDLMAALEASVEASKKRRGPRKAARKVTRKAG